MVYIYLPKICSNNTDMNNNRQFQYMALLPHLHAIFTARYCHLVRMGGSMPPYCMVLSSIGKFYYYELSRRVFKVEKSNYSIHFCPSARNIWASAERILVQFCIGAFHHSIEEFQVSLKSDKSEEFSCLQNFKFH